MKLLYKLIIILSFTLNYFLILPASAQETPSLQTKDVIKIMNEMLEQHVEQKEITPTLLKNSFRTYIDQFDPERIYLLKQEVDPLIHPSNRQLEQNMQQYRKTDLSAYTRINDTIRKAIIRSRDLRKKVEQNPDLFHLKQHPIQTSEDQEGHKPFATTTEELRRRLKENLLQFIEMQKNHFGADAVARKQQQVIHLYEKELREIENQYLFQDDLGKALSSQNQEHLFTMHVLKALASSLDSHSKFLDPTEASDMKLRLEKSFSGTGIILEEGLDGVVIAKLIPGSPAAKSGRIKINDQLVQIDGRPLDTYSYSDVLEAMRGKEGTKVTLMLKREEHQNSDNAEFIVTELTRAPIAINEDRVDISAEPVAGGIIGKIVLHSFYQGDHDVSSEKDVRAAIKRLEKQGNLKGLILDLRNNSGGYLIQAVKVAGLFIRSGIIVISKYANGDEKVYRDLNGKAAYTGPLVILTSRATASAAEIVAEALQDYGIALIVGDDHTYGKGSIQSQTVTNNQNSNHFKVTVGKYYTVGGESPQIRGVQSDIVVPGPYMKQHIGERYLDDSLPPDTIPDEFNDDLKDIDVQNRAWYLKYYKPTLQQKVYTWINMIPALQEKSEERLRTQTYNGDIQMMEAINIVKDMLKLRTCQGINCTVKTLPATPK